MASLAHRRFDSEPEIEAQIETLQASGYCESGTGRQWAPWYQREGLLLTWVVPNREGENVHELAPLRGWNNRIRKLGNGCWEWMGGVTGRGYPIVWSEGSRREARQVIYEAIMGEKPDGYLKFDCPVLCVNPAHANRRRK